jgi:SAM-dependent methyltransferase
MAGSGRAGPPGSGLAAERMPGHWLLARLGKRVLRPGGVELTRWMLDALRVGPSDTVVELAAGLGATAPLVLAREPAEYVGVDRDGQAVAALSALAMDQKTRVGWREADAARTGLPEAGATVVYGEAMLTMQPDAAKRRIVREAHRLLAPSGRYGIHEMCLTPDDLDSSTAAEIRAALSGSVHVGARPLTMAEWRALLAEAGFTVEAETTAPMHLLEPRRLIADEGLPGALRIFGRLARDRAARRRVREMRGVFRRYRTHLAAVSLVATR